jgi:hypothetical protein
VDLQILNIFVKRIPPQNFVFQRILKGLFSFREICPSAELICIARVPRFRALGDITVYPWKEFLDMI